MNDSGAKSDRSPSVWRKPTTYLYIAAWVAALLATGPSLGAAPLIYLFPLGLVAFFDLHRGNDGGWWMLGACAAIYVVHGIFYFRSHRRIVRWTLFALLVIMLTCNVQGCRQMWNRH